MLHMIVYVKTVTMNLVNCVINVYILVIDVHLKLIVLIMLIISVMKIFLEHIIVEEHVINVIIPV